MVVLDYGSERPIAPLMREFARAEIALFRIPWTPRHRMAHANDAEHLQTTGNFRVNLDADNMLTRIGWRMPAGGTAEQGGISTSPSVGVNDFSPLVTGAAYELWVTDRNSRGDGPPGNRVSFTA